MNYVKEGEKVNMIIEQVPIIEVATGNIISWKIIRCFRVNTPKKKEEPKAEKLESKKSEEEML